MIETANGQGKRIIAWVHHGLGDVAMALPALVSVDKNLPEGSTLILLVKSAVEEHLLRLVYWKSTVECVNLGYGGRWDYRGVFRLGFALRRSRPDAFLAPHASPGLLPALFARSISAVCSVGPYGRWWRIGFSRCVRLEESQHKVRYYAKFAEKAELVRVLSTDIKLRSDVSSNQAAAELLPEDDRQRWVILAPGSSNLEVHKRWPSGSFRELITLILAECQNVNILLLGSPGEAGMLRDLASGSHRERCRVLAQADIGLSLAAIRRGALMVSGCTGAGHLAALVGTPIIGLYGPTNPSVTGPFSPRLRIVRRAYKCAPCYRRGFETGCQSPTCLRDITAREVLGAVRDELSGAPYPRRSPVRTTKARCASRELLES